MTGCKRRLLIDLETYSSAEIGKTGAFKYAEAPDFEILLLAYAWDDGPVRVLDLLDPSGHDELPDIVAGILDPDTVKIAHNSAFERACLTRYLGRDLPPEEWEDTMILAAMNGLPLSLDAAGAALELQDQKIKEGTALISYFCKPCKPTIANGGRARNLPEHAPDKWERFKTYCKRDVEVEQAIYQRLRSFPVTDFERKVWALDARINERGVMIDTDLVASAIAVDEAFTTEHMAEMQKLTGLENPNSVAQLKDWLETVGMSVDSLNKATVKDLQDRATDATTRRVLQLRQQLGKTSNTKYETIAASAGPDHRVRGTLQFYGANRTGRWAGRLLQVQNLPRTYLDHQAEWRSIVKLHDPEALALLTDNVSDTLSQLIRTALVPGKGCTFVDADFSAIEARLIAWLAGEEWVLDVFRTTGKIYEATAARIFGVPFDSIVKGNPNYKYRQRGKVATLALGYQGGVGAMKRMGGDQLGLDDDGLMDIVRRWRRQNPSICKLWDTMQKAAVHTIRTGRTTVPRVGVTLRKELALGFPFPFLTMQLPSGRKLFYADPGTTPDDRITYKEWDTGSWREAETYGGKLTENLTQAVGRDCLAFALDNLRRAGYQVVFHVHDEVIIELPTTQDAEAALDNVVRIMSIVPPWAEGLPLNAAGWYGDFFTKD